MTTRTLACLSVRQPWASLIVHGYKPWENRDWPCSYRGPLLIHAGKTWKADEQAAYDELMRIALDHGDVRRQTVLFTSRVELGALVGVVDMIDCVSREEHIDRGGRLYDGWREWFVGRYGYRLARPCVFKPMILYKGQQGLFRVPFSVVRSYLEK